VWGKIKTTGSQVEQLVFAATACMVQQLWRQRPLLLGRHDVACTACIMLCKAIQCARVCLSVALCQLVSQVAVVARVVAAEAALVGAGAAALEGAVSCWLCMAAAGTCTQPSCFTLYVLHQLLLNPAQGQHGAGQGCQRRCQLPA
jgi:hypothetical protein